MEKTIDQIKQDQLNRYIDYINKLADAQSPEIFTNGGKEYASQLMSVLFQHTRKEARVFCCGFRSELITTKPYWSALQEYLNDPTKTLHVLVESDEAIHDAPLELLRNKRNERNDNTVDFRLIKEEDKQKIFDGLNGTHCNFAVFDDDKFRFEYSPEGYKAFGSFNHRNNCEILINLFDRAFENAELLN